jgi:hypothetical protein
MMAGRGWGKPEGQLQMLVLQIGGLIVIAGLIVTLVMLRKKDHAAAPKVKSTSTRI